MSSYDPRPVLIRADASVNVARQFVPAFVRLLQIRYFSAGGAVYAQIHRGLALVHTRIAHKTSSTSWQPLLSVLCYLSFKITALAFFITKRRILFRERRVLLLYGRCSRTQLDEALIGLGDSVLSLNVIARGDR